MSVGARVINRTAGCYTRKERDDEKDCNVAQLVVENVNQGV